jgi:hypothetical protein
MHVNDKAALLNTLKDVVAIFDESENAPWNETAFRMARIARAALMNHGDDAFSSGVSCPDDVAFIGDTIDAEAPF